MTAAKLTSNDRKTFINSLSLARPTRATEAFFASQPSGVLPGPQVDDGKPGNFVDAGSVVSFVSGLSADHQAAVLNSTLLAQLAANKQYDRERDTTNWYKFYRNVLERIGWQMPAFGFNEYQASGNNFTMDKAVLDILAAVATSNELAAITAAINAAKALADDDGRITLFDHSSTQGNSGSFQIGVASDAGGVVAMKLGALYFTTDTSVTKVLWFTFAKNSTHLYASSQEVNLDTAIYEVVKTDIESKLGNLAKTFVQNIDI